MKKAGLCLLPPADIADDSPHDDGILIPVELGAPDDGNPARFVIDERTELGRELLIVLERGSDLVAVRLDSANRTVVVAATAASERVGRFSPDGRFIAYASNESGRDEVYVVAFPSVTGRRQVSPDGGRLPRWSRTSGELFYWKGSTLMAARVSTTGEFRREVPTALFTMEDADPTYSRWDVSADGKRFLIAGKNPDAPAR